MRARPDFVDFADDMVIEKHIAIILDRFDVNVENVSEIELDNLGTDGAKVAAGQGIKTHTDFNECPNVHGLLNHSLRSNGPIVLQECLLIGRGCRMLKKIGIVSEAFKQMIQYDNVLGETVDK